MGDLSGIDTGRKGFGDSGFVHKYEGGIKPLGKRIIVKNMHFGEQKTKGGIIILDDDGKDRGIHPRWAQVHAIGPKQDDVHIGEWILVAHGRWTRTFILKEDDGEHECRMIDEEDILLVSETEPEANSKQAGYINTGGMKQMKSLPGND